VVEGNIRITKVSMPPFITENRNLDSGDRGDEYSIAIGEPPTEDVTFKFEEVDGGLLTVLTQNVTFTPANYEVPQSFFLAGTDDFVIMPKYYTGWFQLEISSLDGRFMLPPSEIRMSVADNDKGKLVGKCFTVS
jgi:hypothetical protein